MKTKIIIAILALLPFLAIAQTNSNNVPTTPGQFALQVGQWITGVDTNATWTNCPVDLWTGVNYQSGLNTSAELGASYDLWKPTAGVAVAPEVAFRNAGIAGTILSGQGGVGLSVFYYDLKLTGYVDGGYSPSVNSGTPTGYLELGARLKKKMTTSTYTGIGMAWDANFKGKSESVPVFTVFLGWCF